MAANTYTENPEQSKPSNTIKYFGFAFLVLAVCVSIAYTNHNLNLISNKACLTNKASVEVFFGALSVKCELLSMGQVSTVYASLASVWTIIFLALALILQTKEMEMQRREFIRSNELTVNNWKQQRDRNIADIEFQNTMIDWEKSKLAINTYVNLKSIISAYVGSPPRKFREEDICFSTNTLSGLIDYSAALSKTSKEDYLATQPTYTTIDADKLRIESNLKLIAELVADENVLKYTPFSNKDHENLKKEFPSVCNI